jgi:hypothetical protein
VKNRPDYANVRFSERDAARVRQQLEREFEAERKFTAAWLRFKRERELAGGGIERRAA